MFHEQTQSTKVRFFASCRKFHLISSFFGRRLEWNPFFLLAGALLFDEKTAKSAAQPEIEFLNGIFSQGFWA
jgi:hypothetical protein